MNGSLARIQSRAPFFGYEVRFVRLDGAVNPEGAQGGRAGLLPVFAHRIAAQINCGRCTPDQFIQAAEGGL